MPRTPTAPQNTPTARELADRFDPRGASQISLPTNPPQVLHPAAQSP